MDALLTGIIVFVVTLIILVVFTGLFAIDLGADARPGLDGSPQER
jgi:hypothetical protein